MIETKATLSPATIPKPLRSIGNASVRKRVLVGLTVVFALTLGVSSAQSTRSAAQIYDFVIENGHVMDPESGLDAVRNIGISGDTIKVITSEPIKGQTTIDASGLVVAPGFIDLHQHDHEPSDYALNVMDGVTSTLELETGTADVDGWYAKRVGKALINFGVSAGHLPARVAVMHDLAAIIHRGMLLIVRPPIKRSQISRLCW